MSDSSQTVGFMGILLLLLLAGAAAGLILLPQSRRMTGKFLLFSLPLFVIVAAFFLLGVLPFGRDIGLLLLLAGAGIVGLILALGRRRISGRNRRSRSVHAGSCRGRGTALATSR